MADHLSSELVVDALEMALYRRCPERGLIHHSDMGRQYTAVLFTKRCERAGVEISMGSVGDCSDKYGQQQAEQLQAALQSTPSSNGSLVGITPTTSRRTSSVALAPMANGQPQPETALGSATGSAQATTTWSRPERLAADLTAG